MTTTAEVVRTGGESNANLIRRFSKRVQSSGALKKARAKRFSQRHKSPLKKKQEALKCLTKRASYERLKKLGKIRDVGYKK